MHSENLKLVAVFNSFNLELYEANNKHITSTLGDSGLSFTKHAREEKQHGLHQRSSSHGGAFEPHTSPQDIEHHTAAKEIAEYLEAKLKDQHKYKELIIISDPKTLGYFRQHVGHNSSKIMTKSIAKNLVHHDIKQIEHAVFAEE